jgi:hypothetical protein
MAGWVKLQRSQPRESSVGMVASTMIPPKQDAGPWPVEEPRLWEQPGAVRRDVAPHRGELLCLLASISLAFSAAGVLFLVPIVVGVPLAFRVSAMASRDLDRMGGGQLDPRGRAETHAAFVRAEIARYLGLVAPLLCLLLWWGSGSVLGWFW